MSSPPAEKRWGGVVLNVFREQDTKGGDLLGGEQANPAERRRVTDTAHYVLAPHALVVRERRVELPSIRDFNLPGEAPAPRQLEPREMEDPHAAPTGMDGCVINRCTSPLRGRENLHIGQSHCVSNSLREFIDYVTSMATY